MKYGAGDPTTRTPRRAACQAWRAIPRCSSRSRCCCSRGRSRTRRTGRPPAQLGLTLPSAVASARRPDPPPRSSHRVAEPVAPRDTGVLNDGFGGLYLRVEVPDDLLEQLRLVDVTIRY